MTMPDQYVIGIDIGTGSARAGLFDLAGHRRAIATAPIETWKPHPEWAEQSSDDIWNAVGANVRQIVAESGVDPAKVVGIGFDATCSLVVLDKNDRPLTVSDTGDNARNVIVWMDHRAIEETEEINAGGYDVLRYVGGRLSPEMETPKLLWLKRHLPSTWASAGKFLDLADFLVYQSTGRDIRSLCTVVCKWTYLGHERRWDKDYFAKIGLGDVFDGRVGEDVRDVGEFAGTLTDAAAAHLGVTTSTKVGVGLIDAHSGGLGLLGAVLKDSVAGQETNALQTALALIGGTSSCHMAVSVEPRFIPGIWGPYWSAMVPGMWLTEGGQSATGALIDYALQNHAAWPDLAAEALEHGVTVYEIVSNHLEAMARAQNLPEVAYLTRDIHVLDYHLGNRSPIADPRARGLIDGLVLDTSRDSLALAYLATIQAVAYGTKAIVDAMNANGYDIRRIHVVGGGTKNPLWLREHADILGMPLHLPDEPESVLLGSAVLGASAAGAYPTVVDAMRSMCRSGSVVKPSPSTRRYHDAKFDCYRELYAQQAARRERMASVT
jgi:FGGY-family pentulose kinase